MAKAKNSLFDDLLGTIENDYAGVVSDGTAADVSGWTDTGSMSLNALLSGSIYGGFPDNKVTALAGEPSTGKTWYALQAVKSFLENNPDGGAFVFESESAISRKMMEERGIDVSRTYLIPVTTIQEFRTQAVRILDKYLEMDESDRQPMMMVLDSLGMLSTEKEVSDIADGKDTRDMTRAQLIRGAFRVLTLKLGRAKVPMIITNHVYDVVGSYIPMKKMGGGAGLEYAASTIIFLSKKKEKQGDEQVGNVITAKLQKSRQTIEQKKVSTLLYFEKGLDRYYGLLDIAEAAGLVKKVANKFEFADGTKAFESVIVKNPEKYFTDDLLAQIDEACKKEFLYGQTNNITTE